MKDFFDKVYLWFDERVKLESLVELMGKKYVPIHRNSGW